MKPSVETTDMQPTYFTVGKKQKEWLEKDMASEPSVETKIIKILNLYAGIGGNRKLWGDEHEITAVEFDPIIAQVYKDNFPEDEVVVGDAHEYLENHFSEFDFIWSSPPCPSHSRLRKGFSVANGAKPIYPDMKLYEEILFLQGFFKGKYCVENVRSWYKPLVEPQDLSRHYYWANFPITDKKVSHGKINLTGGWEKQNDQQQVEQLQVDFGYDLSPYKISYSRKRRLLRNCVEPEIGLHILQESQKEEK
jgi:DNA (cytosine-5)-methyltransferase 1